MSITILEVLEGAEYNLKNATIQIQKKMGLSQLHNAIKLLSFGKSPDDDFNEEDLK